jgi:hypothetical protein
LDGLVTVDVLDRSDALRCRETGWLRARRAELVCVQRRARAEELAIVGILDERGALEGGEAAQAGVTARVERETVETARRLESLPSIARAAAEGRLSDEQLAAVTQLADESTDAEWAERAPNCSPVELRRMVRTRAKPTVEESWRRRDARCLWMKWEEQRSMLRFGGELPDVMGAEFEATINELVDKWRPAPGCTWDTRAHRGADALVHLCRLARGARGDDTRHAGSDPHTPTLAPQPNLQVHVPLEGPATIAGIPIPDAKLEQLRANATVEAVLVDHHGAPIAIGRRCSVVSTKIARSVSLRDGHCRWPGCDARIGLEIHHLVPRSLGGTDDVSNLAAVCTLAHHHEQLIPHGPYALVGNPNMPDGLHLVVYAELSPDEARTYGLPPPPGHRRRRE